MILTSIGKRFVYVSILMMLASMLLPWDSLEDYTYSESMGLLMNIIPAIIFLCAAAIVVLKPLGMILSRIGTNVVFLILCLMNGIVLYTGMQYYPDSYTIGYFLFPLIISIPYYFSIQNLSLLNSYFEAISGFTSTGFTIFENVKQLDENFKGRPGIGYGLTETNALGTLAGGDEYISNPSTAGRVVPPVTEIKIIDSKWNEVPLGEIGEIAIKSESNMIGYWKNDAATKECVNEAGWFKSGDMGKFEGPLLYILDRIKDMVIRGGENIACPEVENAIYDHPDVLEASVFGIPDQRLGEILCSAVVLREGSKLNKDDLVNFLSDKLAAFKIPALIKFMDSNLPRVASGKFDKPALREMFISK